GEPHEVLERVRRGGARPMDQAGPLTPLLTEMLQPQPDRRPTADEVRSRLKDLVGGWEPPPVEGPTRSPWRRHPLLQPAAAVVVVAAAVAAVVLVRQREAPAAQQHVSSGGLIGDERSADPCALTDEEELRQFGPTRLLTNYGNYNRCDVLVDVHAKDPVDVELQLVTLASRGVQGRPMEVVEEARKSDECDRTVVADDQYAVRVAAKLENPPLDLCSVTDVATATVLEVLHHGPIARRAIPLPAGSLAHVDACALLDREAIVTAAAINGGPAVNVFGHWACKWFDTVGGPAINLRLDQHSAQEPVEGEPVDLGGHRGYVELDTDSSKSCTVNVPYQSAHVLPRADISRSRVGSTPRTALIVFSSTGQVQA
ncbi:hypothetical protein AB0G02_35490, partial [Actinosynnema sp. NPDC023658]